MSFVGKSTNLESNPYSWTAFGNVLFIDQPVGTGYSTSSIPNPAGQGGIPRMTSDFEAWLGAFFQAFPDMQSKNIHLIGESYAGIFIPYFANEMVRNNNTLPLKISSITMGDGMWANFETMLSVGIGQYIRENRQILNASTDLIQVFDQADQSCGFDDIISQAGHYPARGTFHVTGNPDGLNYLKRSDDIDSSAIASDHLFNPRNIGYQRSENNQQNQKREAIPSAASPQCTNLRPTTPQQVNDTINNSPCGKCATYSAATLYFQNIKPQPCFGIYDIETTCDMADPGANAQNYFIRLDVQNSVNVFPTLFRGCSEDGRDLFATSPNNFATPPVYNIIPDLINNHKIPFHFYQGKSDMVINHIGIELGLQNMSWNGIQGFSSSPTKPFYMNNAYPVESSTRPNPPGGPEGTGGSGSGGSGTGSSSPKATSSSPALKLIPPKLLTMPGWSKSKSKSNTKRAPTTSNTDTNTDTNEDSTKIFGIPIPIPTLTPNIFNQISSLKSWQSTYQQRQKQREQNNKRKIHLHQQSQPRRDDRKIQPRASSGHNINGPQVGTFGARDGVTYHLFNNAGHSVFIDQPEAMYTFIRDIVLNPNPMHLHT